MLKTAMRELAEEVYDSKYKCEVCTGVSNLEGTDKQAKKRKKKLEQDDTEAKLRKLLSEEELYELVERKWGEQLFKKTKKVVLVEELAIDVGIVHDVSGQEGGFLKGNLRLMKMLKERSMKRQSNSGDIYVDEADLEVLTGPPLCRPKRGRTYLVIVDFKEKKEFVRATFSAISKLMSISEREWRFIAPDGVVGHMTRKILEYVLRNKEIEVGLHMEPGKEVMKKKREQGEHTQTILVVARGKKYADLLREIKRNVPAEEVGNVLSLRKAEQGAVAN